MGIQERDYYRKRKLTMYSDKRKILWWLIIILIILSLILSSLSF